MKNTEKCGHVAIIGRPNVGKSTLLNGLVGQKISITSTKPQTTRTQILGIKTEGPYQAVYIDTPGIHPAEKRAMNRYMNRLATAVIGDADVIVFVVEASRFTEMDEKILSSFAKTKAPVILAINKIDLLKDKRRLLPLITAYSEKYPFAAVVPLSARDIKDVDLLQNKIFSLLPDGPALFPELQLTDKSERFQIAELIREKLIRATSQELPYATTVVVESIERTEKLININAIIWVERTGQKAIVIGKNGEVLKKIGSSARKDIEQLLQKKVFLRLWVKVKSDWTDDERLLQSLGYE